MVLEHFETEEEKRIARNTLEAARLRAEFMANAFREMLEEIKKIYNPAKDSEEDGR